MAPKTEDDSIVGLHNLQPAPGSRKGRKRVGRGNGSGHGKTAGRGHKGYGSRSGAKDRARFEGGQTPIHRRMRKLRGLSVDAVLGLSKENGQAAETRGEAGDERSEAVADEPPAEAPDTPDTQPASPAGTGEAVEA